MSALEEALEAAYVEWDADGADAPIIEYFAAALGPLVVLRETLQQVGFMGDQGGIYAMDERDGRALGWRPVFLIRESTH